VLQARQYECCTALKAGHKPRCFQGRDSRLQTASFYRSEPKMAGRVNCEAPSLRRKTRTKTPLPSTLTPAITLQTSVRELIGSNTRKIPAAGNQVCPSFTYSFWILICGTTVSFLVLLKYYVVIVIIFDHRSLYNVLVIIYTTSFSIRKYTFIH
jgi:hypothetical protein